MMKLASEALELPSEIDAHGMYFAYDEKLLSSPLSSSLLLTLPLDELSLFFLNTVYLLPLERLFMLPCDVCTEGLGCLEPLLLSMPLMLLLSWMS